MAGGKVPSILEDVISSTTYSSYMHWKDLLMVLQRPLSLTGHPSVILTGFSLLCYFEYFVCHAVSYLPCLFLGKIKDATLSTKS